MAEKIFVPVLLFENGTFFCENNRIETEFYETNGFATNCWQNKRLENGSFVSFR